MRYSIISSLFSSTIIHLELTSEVYFNDTLMPHMEFLRQWVVRVMNLKPILSVFLRLLLHQLPQSKIPGKETAEDQPSNHLLGNVLGSRILMKRERNGAGKRRRWVPGRGEVEWLPFKSSLSRVRGSEPLQQCFGVAVSSDHLKPVVDKLRA